MSEAYTILKDNPEIINRCPNCGMMPFESFLRGQVARRKYKYFFFGRWPEYAVICSGCKEIVGHEWAIRSYIKKEQVMTVIKSLLLALLLLASTAQAQTCPQRIPLHAVPASNRQGTIIYKSNWNIQENREQTPTEGNHASKGMSLLINYRQKKLIPNLRSIEVRSLDCTLIAHFGRYPRCTSQGCGDWERWYSRTAGGSRESPISLIAKSGTPSALIRLKDRQWAVIQNLLNQREIKR